MSDCPFKVGDHIFVRPERRAAPRVQEFVRRAAAENVMEPFVVRKLTIYDGDCVYIEGLRGRSLGQTDVELVGGPW